MKKHLNKRRVVLAAIIAVALGLGAGAYAYFTAAGAGTGSASVGSSTAIVLTPTITGTLYPGGTAATVSILVKNNGAGSQRVGTVSLASIAPDAGHSGCTTVVGGFSMAAVAVNQVLTSSGSPGDHTTVVGSLAMADTGLNQDVCQGATLTLNLTSN